MASAAARRSEAEAGIPSAVAELRANEAHLAKVAAYCQRKYAQARTESVREAATQETRAYLTVRALYARVPSLQLLRVWLL